MESYTLISGTKWDYLGGRSKGKGASRPDKRIPSYAKKNKELYLCSSRGLEQDSFSARLRLTAYTLG